MILFPRRSGQHKKLDSSKEDIEAYNNGEKETAHKVNDVPSMEDAIGEVSTSDMQGEEAAYRKLRDARSDARLVGVREKRAKAKAEESAAAKK